MIIQKLYDEVRLKGNVCVGLDTALEYLPESFHSRYEGTEEKLFRFNRRIIDATCDVSACYKLQIAYYEAYGLEGLRAYSRTLKYLKEKSLLSIADVKRGDISKTAEMYAKAHFDGDFEADFITLNPYMGFESMDPYLPYVKNGEKGIFVLLRTSNPGAKDIEYLESNGKKIYYHVGDHLADLGNHMLSSCGYSNVCAVVGGTHTDEATEIRERYPNMFFLIPGYGAQGATGSDVRLYLSRGNGGVVNSSRGILTAYRKVENGEYDFDALARKAVIDMREDIGYGKEL